MSARAEATVDCSVLTPVLDEEAHIEATIAAMRAQRFEGRLQFVFADGGSRDQTRRLIADAAREDARIVLADNPGRTVTSGLNVALRHAEGRWVARMDAHSVYPPDYLQRGVARLRAGDTRWVSGPQLPVGRGPVSRAVALGLASELGRSGSRRWAAGGGGGDDAGGEYLLDSGVFCGVWSRDTLLEYGGWDEDWRVNEDSELAARFLERGERLVCLPAMTARYAPRDTLRGLWSQYSLYGCYRVKTAVRHPDTLRRPHLAAPALVATVGASALAPAPLRRPARAAVALYGALLVRPAVAALRRGEPAGDAARVPLALATMQLAWGVGTWRGMARFGVPARAAARTLRG